MKKLFLLRHAHAESHHIMNFDHDRRLSQIGKSEALNLAKLLRDYGFKDLDTFLVSSSSRTLETAQIIKAELGVSFSIDDDIYNCDLEVLTKIIDGLSDENIAILGHNPAMSELATKYFGRNLYLETAHGLLVDFTNSQGHLCTHLKLE